MTLQLASKPEPDARADLMAQISGTETIVNEARNGRPFILVDADNDASEGSIVVPAQFATPERVNDMARHARGLIFLAITRERAEFLKLLQMSDGPGSGHGSAFTVSIEAREGVTTGISAFDRARTIAVAINSMASDHDLVSPGHVFPLVARDGGVLARAGHAEAAVDIARAAGVMPAAALCQILNQDGSAARLSDLLLVARALDMRIGSISDLIAYRRKKEVLVERVASAPFVSRYADDFTVYVYRDLIDGAEHVALSRGDIRPDCDTLVRVHRLNLAADILGSLGAPADMLPAALEQIARHDGPAVMVLVRDPDRQPMMHSVATKPSATPARARGRDYGIGAQILLDIGVGRMVLLTSSNRQLAALSGFGLEIVDRQPVLDVPTASERD